MTKFRMAPLALFCVLMVGCAPALSTVKQTATNAEKVIAAADAALADADAKQYADAMYRANGGDLQGAKEQYAAWAKVYDKIKQIIDDAHATIKAISNNLPLVELGLAKSPDLSAWMSQIMKAVTGVVELMGAFGMHIGVQA